MKKQLLLLLFVVIVQFADGQVVVANDYFNYLYVGVENPISISANSIPDHNMTIAVNRGSLKKTGVGKYSWTVCSKEVNFVVIKIYNKQTLVDSFFFKLKELPTPTVFIYSQDKEFLFKGTRGVRAEMENVPLNVTLSIPSFLVTIIKKSGQTIKIENAGGAYTNETRKAFDMLVAGDRIILSDFTVKVGCETKPRNLTTVIDQVCSGKPLEFRY